nr:signal recognition particle receptor subunit alpha [Candidatus Syntrophosphaera sp.]
MGLISNLRKKLARTKSGFLGKIAEAVSLRGKVDDELMEQIEEILLKCDTGVEMTGVIMERLTERVRIDRITEAAEVQTALQEIMESILVQDYAEAVSLFDEIDRKPYIIVFVGVNGVGKTTSIGKIADALGKAGKHVMVIAGDTFRAAAIEQLAIWTERAGATLIRSQQDADPASVIYDGISSAPFDAVIREAAGDPNRVLPDAPATHAWVNNPLPASADTASELKCLATAIYFEARGENERGASRGASRGSRG